MSLVTISNLFSSNVCPHCYRLLDKVVKNARHLEDIYPVTKQLGGRHGTRGYDVPMKHIHVSLLFCY